MKNNFVFATLSSLILLSTQNVFATNAPYQLNCWDGSYAYNTLSVLQVEDGYEVSFVGKTLGDLKLDVDSYVMKKNEFKNHVIDVKFPTNSCVQNGKYISCQITNAELFTEQSMRDLGKDLLVITNYPTDKLELNIKENDKTKGHEIKLKVFGGIVPGWNNTDQQEIGLSKFICNNEGSVDWGGTHFGGHSFSQKLRDYLKSH